MVFYFTSFKNISEVYNKRKLPK
nr:unnamed protein product [Callosobruchus analis]